MNRLLTKKGLLQLKNDWNLSDSYLFIQKTANYVFEGKIGNQSVIIKLTPPSRRSYDSIMGELAFIEHLLKFNLPIAKPYRSINNNYCEKIEGQDDIYSVTIFEKIKGWHPKAEDYSIELIQLFGKTLAKMHLATKEFPVQEEEGQRLNWEEQIFIILKRYRSLKLDSGPIDHLEKLGKRFKKLPKENYGLIHADLHPGNIFILDKKPTIKIFDFDSTCYHWFLFDIATSLFHTREYFERLGKQVDPENLRENLLKGYQTLMHLSKKEVDLIDDFIELRAYIIYCWTSCQLESHSGKGVEILHAWNTWAKRFF